MKMTRHGHHYHLEGCPAIAGRTWEEATPSEISRRGLTPCDVCHPDAPMMIGAAGGGGGGAGDAYDGPIPFLSDAENEAMRFGIPISSVPPSVKTVEQLHEAITKATGSDDALSTGISPDQLPEIERQLAAFESYEGELEARHWQAVAREGAEAVTEDPHAPLPDMPDWAMGSMLRDSMSQTPPGREEPEFDPLPRWDAPLHEGNEAWVGDIEAAATDRILARQVAAQVEGAMGLWPEQTRAMLAWALANGFMTDPASTRFHLCVPGGLACHSTSVADRLVRVLARPENKAAREELGEHWREIAQVAALWHDACKVGFYERLDEPSPKTGAWFGVARDRMRDRRHGDLSENLVRAVYGDLLPQVAYDAISLHMGEWDYRRAPDKWTQKRLKEHDAKQAELAEKRADQDARIAEGRLWPRLHQSVNETREAGEQVQGMDPRSAAARLITLGVPEADALREIVHSSDDEAEKAAAIEEVAGIYMRAPGMSESELAAEIVRKTRAEQDAKAAAQHEADLRAQEDAERFCEWADRMYEEHSFIRLMHEADKWSTEMDR